MDIDSPEQIQIDEPGPKPSGGKQTFVVPVDDAHPFDLDAYISLYSGRTVIQRLFHIIQHCPTLATQAFDLARQHIVKGRDPSLYQTAVTLITSATGAQETPAIDKAWIDGVLAENQKERMKLEVELKTYQSNMIKESIRMAHRDLGGFYHMVGDSPTALKHYTKIREFCSTSRHILEMCISVLELLIEQLNYAHLSTYVYKAESALEGAGLPSSSTGNDTAAESSASSQPTKLLHKKTAAAAGAPPAERDLVQTKISAAAALSHLGQGHYEKAAQTFIKLGNPDKLGDWSTKIISPADVAIYGTLCALATFTRGAIKSQILENEAFGVYIEQEPHVRELIEAYMGNKFKVVLEILEKHSTKHLLDFHLAPHISELMHLIRDRALVLYFTPFSQIRLPHMANAFGLDVNEMEKEVVRLILSGDIKAKVDSQNKILKAKDEDHRTRVFSNALKAGTEMMETNRKLLLRMRLQQADLVVKAPKQQQGPSITTEYMITE